MSQILESALLALHSIWTNKLRSFLTVLGNIVAVTSIVTVVSLIQGMNAMVSNAIVNRVGADSFTVLRVPPVRTADDEERTRSNPLLTLDEAEAIRARSTTVKSVMAQAERGASISYRDQRVDNVRLEGVTREYIDFSSFDAERGRMMSPTEVGRGQPVTILGWDTADRLFGDINPIDKVVTIAGEHFRVVGVSSKKGAIFGNSLDSFAVIPLSAYLKMFGPRQPLQIMVKPTSTALMSAAEDEAVVALRVKRHLSPKARDNFGLAASDTILSLYHQATTGIFAVLVGVVALSLLVGGIVIMNIMLMVVSERTREIGLRKALGAKRRDIMSQVLTEAVTLSTFGGVVGILLGALAARVIASVTPLPATLELWSVVLGIGITAGVGLFFGAYPASRAARLDPIEALRRE